MSEVDRCTEAKERSGPSWLSVWISLKLRDFNVFKKPLNLS